MKEKNTYSNIHIFWLWCLCHQNFFVHRTLVLGSTCGESLICWIFFLGDWEQSMLWLVCGSFLSVQIHCWSQWWFQRHPRPALSLTWPLQAGAHNHLPWWASGLYLVFREVREGIAEKESHWPHLSPPSNFIRTNVSSPSPALLSGERIV